MPASFQTNGALMNRINHNMTCGCCGQHTKGRQWFNQDKGFTICPYCVGIIKGSKDILADPEYFKQTYGRAGEHYNL